MYIRNIKRHTIIAGLSVLCINISAQIQMPSVFTDGMVLQQETEAAIWGWGNPSENISVIASWAPNDTVKTIVDNHGKWQIFLDTPKAGGPFRIDITGAYEKKTLNNVMLGEVWLCSGQSNMEWSVNMGIINGEEEALNATCNNIRIFHIPKQGAYTPQNDVRACWEISSPQSMRRTSATAYFFAKYLAEHLKIPVGIIVAAWGGTPAEVWTPANLITEDKILSENRHKEYPWWPIEPGVLFNQMINPVIPYKLAGCIWYQGESNHENAGSYSYLMSKMVQSWRKLFNQKLPFYYVQIAPHTYNSKGNTPALLREQQQKVLSMLPDCGMINISDLIDDVKDIHPRNKKAIGERLAFMVMDKKYGKYTSAYQSPYFKSVTVKGKKVIIDFEGEFNWLTSTSPEIIGLKIISDENQTLTPKARIKGKHLIISTKGTDNPFHISYCFDDATIGSLRSNDGIPVLPFRTPKINL